MDETFLTVDEVADLLKLNPQTVRNWIVAGSLRSVRVGKRRVRVHQSELERFIESGEEAAQQEDAAADSQPVAAGHDATAQAQAALTEALRDAARVSEGGGDALVPALRGLAVAADNLAAALQLSVAPNAGSDIDSR
jgi:excisionase family DNA binding protein